MAFARDAADDIHDDDGLEDVLANSDCEKGFQHPQQAASTEWQLSPNKSSYAQGVTRKGNRPRMQKWQSPREACDGLLDRDVSDDM